MKVVLFLFLTSLLFSCDYIKSDAPTTKSKEKKKEKVYNGVKKNYIKGKLASTVTYKDSLKNGIAINYYPDGKINMEFNYKDNEKNGSFKWYYENGNLYQEGNYKDGMKEGVFKMYRENGTIKAEMPWSNDYPCIGLKEYTESGKLKPVPKIVVKEKNTIKLDNKYELNISLSNNSEYVEFYEGNLSEDKYLTDYYPELPGSKGKAKLTLFVIPGTYIMKTVNIYAKIMTRDKNYYILEKKVNIAVENR